MNYDENRLEGNNPKEIKPEENKKGERKIYRSQFNPRVADGDVEFTVLGAMYDTINTQNGLKEVVKLRLELKELGNMQSQTEVKTFTLFVDYNLNGRFYWFAEAVMTGLGIDYFVPDKIIGCRGKGVLSHYKSKTNDFTYPQLSNWVFYQTNEKVEKALSQYLSEDGSDFELTDEDLDF